jgi:hypothetical protein
MSVKVQNSEPTRLDGFSNRSCRRVRNRVVAADDKWQDAAACDCRDLFTDGSVADLDEARNACRVAVVDDSEMSEGINPQADVEKGS